MNDTIHLQGIGRVPAKLAGNVVVGDILVWNYGYTSRVLSIRQASPCFIELTILEVGPGHSEAEGKQFTRRLKIDRLVAVK